ncbi:hypothetical protein Ddc_15248 [Ditylenchus destructor]|nr:hypothetical protein Ddc_15248 [Ditylenchus destructor]
MHVIHETIAVILVILALCVSPTAQGDPCKENEELIDAYCDKVCERTCLQPHAICFCETKKFFCRCAKGFVRGDNEKYDEKKECVPRAPFCDNKPCDAKCDE